MINIAKTQLCRLVKITHYYGTDLSRGTPPSHTHTHTHWHCPWDGVGLKLATQVLKGNYVKVADKETDQHKPTQ